MKHQHKWEVYSTSICDPCIMVQCECGATGGIPLEKVEQADWNQAFHAPSNPYPLREGLVVKVNVH